MELVIWACFEERSHTPCLTDPSVFPWLANESAWDRARKQETPRKVVRRGRKRSFEPGGEKLLAASLAPVQPGVAPVQTRVAHGARDSWETFVPWVQKTFAPSPKHFRGFSYFRPLSQALWFATLDVQSATGRRNVGRKARNINSCDARREPQDQKFRKLKSSSRVGFGIISWSRSKSRSRSRFS